MCKTSIFQSWILFLKSSNNQTDLNPYFTIKMLAIKKQVLAPLPDHFVSSDDSLILIVFKPFYTLIIILNENRSALWPIKFPEPLIKWPLGSGLNHCSYDHYCLALNPWTPRSDWHGTSPYNTHTLSCKQVMRKLQLIR